MKTKKKTSASSVWVRTVKEPQALQIKITLLDLRPVVWRRFLIANGETLADLRLAVQIIMGWEDSHLDCFTIGRDRYSVRHEMMGEVLEDATDKVAETAVLAYVLPKPGKPFFYTYDFGDSWEHELVVETVQPVEPKAFYPRCLEGARACPPEDCGGAPGYLDLTEVLSNPKHPNYEETKEWFGDKFDPEAFDIATVNKHLRRYFKPLPKRKKSG